MQYFSVFVGEFLYVQPPKNPHVTKTAIANQL